MSGNFAEKSRKITVEKFFYTTASAAIILFVLVNYGRVIFSVLGPFLLAYMGANILKSPCTALSQRLRIPFPIVCIFIVLTFYCALFTLSFLGVSRLVTELYGLLSQTEKLDGIITAITDRISNIFVFDSTYYEFFEKLGVDIWSGISTLVSSAAGKAAGALATYLADAVSLVPQVILFVAVTVISTCYFAQDLKSINKFILFQMPQRVKLFFSECRIQFFKTTSKYIRATLTLSAITFTELFVGLSFIEGKFAFALSFIITLVDLLPILGAGTVLVPWAIIEFAQHSFTRGVCLVLLYLAVSVVRQIAEPKIVGSYIGLPPLVTLISVYIGLRVWGIVGAFALPVVLILFKNLNDKNIIHIYRTPAADKDEVVISAREKYKKFRKKDKEL